MSRTEGMKQVQCEDAGQTREGVTWTSEREGDGTIR